MRILVACADYVNLNGGKALNFVHIRNKEYVNNGIEVEVLNFATKENYSIDGINVMSLESYNKNKGYYDLLVCHAPNVRNHFLFLRKHISEFKQVIFFFHGHEVVKIREVYPEPYEFLKKNNGIKKVIQKLYDSFKLSVWHRYFQKIANKSRFVFVSNNLYKEFLRYLKFENNKLIYDKSLIIHNSVGEVFEKNNYRTNDNKSYDFITIRSNYDSSVYCVDVVKKLAEAFPQFKFLLIGKGKYFDFYKKPDNIHLIDRCLNHEEIVQYIDQSEVALMPTRRDTQGVMSCELATYGIPLITSDIDICKEIFDGFENVICVNEKELFKLDELLDKVRYTNNCSKNKKYFAENTIYKEIGLFKEVLGV